jgi:hypothetical protein
MPNPEEKVREHIRSIDAALYTDLVDEAYSTVWGYLLALSDFEIISERQREDLDRDSMTLMTPDCQRIYVIVQAAKIKNACLGCYGKIHHQVIQLHPIRRHIPRSFGAPAVQGHVYRCPGRRSDGYGS